MVIYNIQDYLNLQWVIHSSDIFMVNLGKIQHKRVCTSDFPFAYYLRPFQDHIPIIIKIEKWALFFKFNFFIFMYSLQLLQIDPRKNRMAIKKLIIDFTFNIKENYLIDFILPPVDQVTQFIINFLYHIHYFECY